MVINEFLDLVNVTALDINNSVICAGYSNGVY